MVGAQRAAPRPTENAARELVEARGRAQVGRLGTGGRQGRQLGGNEDRFGFAPTAKAPSPATMGRLTMPRATGAAGQLALRSDQRTTGAQQLFDNRGFGVTTATARRPQTRAKTAQGGGPTRWP